MKTQEKDVYILIGSKFTFEEKKDKYGYNQTLFVLYNNEYVCHFGYNMTGYLSRFELSNKEGVINSFGEKSKTFCIKKFKESLKEGYIYLTYIDSQEEINQVKSFYNIK